MIKSKPLFLTLLIFSSLFVFSGCKKKHSGGDDIISMERKNLYDLMFNISCYSIKETCLPGFEMVENFYYPESLRQLLSRRYFDNGNFRFYVENYFPDYVGVIDCIAVYDMSSDTADWVEELLAKIEEERIAEELSKMDETDEEVSLLDESQAEEIEKVFSGEVTAKEISDNKNQLNLMEYQKEILMPQKLSDGYIIIHAENNSVTRNFYDLKYRLTTKENWSINSASDAVLIQTETYEYTGDSFDVSAKTTSTAAREIQVKYKQKGIVSEKAEFTLYKEKPYLINKMSFSYDEEGNLIKTVSTDYKYNQYYSRIIELFEKKYIYKPNSNEDIPADYEYYENNVLKMKNKYSVTKGTYTSQIFFNENHSVKTYYENDMRIKDVYTLDNKVVRVKEYAN